MGLLPQTIQQRHPQKERIMEPRDFTYWLKGFFEISGATELTDKQVLIIQDHLNLVFKKETPDRSDDSLDKLRFDEPFNDVLFCGDPNPIAGDSFENIQEQMGGMSDLPVNTPQPQYIIPNGVFETNYTGASQYVNIPPVPDNEILERRESP